MSKFDSRTASRLYSEMPDEQIGSVSELGWYGLYRTRYGKPGFILFEDSLGFVYCADHPDTSSLEAAWQDIVSGYEEWDLAI